MYIFIILWKIIIRARDVYLNGSIVTNWTTRLYYNICITYILCSVDFTASSLCRSLSACRCALKIFHFISCTLYPHIYIHKYFMLLFYMLFITISSTLCRITNDKIFYTQAFRAGLLILVVWFIFLLTMVWTTWAKYIQYSHTYTYSHTQTVLLLFQPHKNMHR